MKIKRLFCLAIALAMLGGCQTIPTLEIPTDAASVPPTTTAAPTTEPVVTEPESTAPPPPISIKITAVGDILLHNTVSLSCKTPDGGFDFSPLFEHVSPLVAGSDIAFVNQEVMLTGEVSNYPRFAAPGEVADALKSTGFNVINLATNHSMDKGGDGLLACLDNVRAHSFDAILGAFNSEEQSLEHIIIEKQGVKFGFLSYTYGLNGLPLPQGKPWMVSVLSETDQSANTDRITRETEAMRPLCDYLIVSMHWGSEYTHNPTKTQREQAQLLCDLGVDLIIGHHPHVLQPLEWLESESGHQTLCMYSLGNFVSNQQRNATMLGGMLDVNLTFDRDTLEFETDAGVIPLVTHYSGGKYTTYPLYSYTDELAAAHGISNEEAALSVGYFESLSQTVLGEYAISEPPR